MSTAPIITDLQKINPSAIIELFTLTTDATLHGSAQTYRFHNGTSLNANGDIIWAGNQYLKMPIQAEGFAFQKGQLPRPTLTVSNALGTITPNEMLGGSTNIVVNVDASGSSVEGDEEQGRELGRMISVAIQSELIKQKRPGGLLT